MGRIRIRSSNKKSMPDREKINADSQHWLKHHLLKKLWELVQEVDSWVFLSVDSWVFLSGTLLADGRTGWFPSNYVEDIPLELTGQAPADKEIPGTTIYLHRDRETRIYRIGLQQYKIYEDRAGQSDGLVRYLWHRITAFQSPPFLLSYGVVGTQLHRYPCTGFVF